ncbi:MAG TPA: fumarylacetoacetase [Gemmatimonadaceae bacterium]
MSIDPGLRSWVASANEAATDFPIQNLPFGVCTRRGASGAGIGVAIGDHVLSIDACVGLGLLSDEVSRAIARDTSLNALMARGNVAAVKLREAIAAVLEEGNSAAARHASSILTAMSAVEMVMPARIGDYTDFYASINHAHNVGTMLRPENPLLPNYKFIPVGYHGRASSVVVSGSDVRRPYGQQKGDPAPTVGPTQSLDYELEVGAFVGTGNALGEPITIGNAETHMWGVCLLNDWSARDVQAWEGQPLGPFLSKNFSTTISPWVVALDALEPYRVPALTRPSGDPAPLPYLSSAEDSQRGGIDFTLEVWIRSAQMRANGQGAMRLSRASFKEMYWTFAQMLTHHAMNGCNLQPGDLLGSGTVSGKDRDAMGCLLERTRRGAEPFDLPSGERRGFLLDGDEVIMRGYAERDGFARIGLGVCRGTVTPAI